MSLFEAFRKTLNVLRALECAGPRPITVLQLEGERRPRPLPARIAACVLPVVRRRLDQGERSVRGLVDEVGPAVVDAPASFAAALTNVNTPEEYEAIVERLRA